MWQPTVHWNPPLEIAPLSPAGVEAAQITIAAWHYLHKRVDARCAVEGYAAWLGGTSAALSLVGRLQAATCRPFYGSLLDVQRGRVEVTRWQVLNLARFWVPSALQPGGLLYGPNLPGFVDRKGICSAARPVSWTNPMKSATCFHTAIPATIGAPSTGRRGGIWCGPTRRASKPGGWRCRRSPQNRMWRSAPARCMTPGASLIGARARRRPQ